MYPDKGPLDGGTEITFSASIGPRLRPISVLFYDNNRPVIGFPVSHFDRQKISPEYNNNNNNNFYLPKKIIK